MRGGLYSFFMISGKILLLLRVFYYNIETMNLIEVAKID